MSTITEDAPPVDAADVEAAAMWEPRSISAFRRPEPFVNSAEAINAGGTWRRPATTSFDEGERSCIVRITPAGTEADAHITAEVTDRHGRPNCDYRIEATVRASWVRRMTAGSRDAVGAAARIVTSLEDLARLPGQSTVRITPRRGRVVRVA